MPFRSDRAWRFTVPPAELWEALADTGAYARWWPWLHAFDGPPLVEGSRASCVIRPPLPYEVRVTLEAVKVVPAALVVTDVSGDLAGQARLEVSPDGDGSTLRLTWDVDVNRPLLRLLDRLARPLLEWGHDWVIDRGMAQFGQAVGLEPAEVPVPR